MRLTKSTWAKVALIALLCLTVMGALTGGCVSARHLWGGIGGLGTCARGAGGSLAPGGGTFAAASLASGDLRLLVPDGTGFTAQVDKVSGSFESAFPCSTDGNIYICGDGGSMHVRASMTSGRVVIGRA